MNKPATVMIINVHSTCNAGDLALLEVTIAQIIQSFGPVQIIISANFPSEKFFLSNPRYHTIPSPWCIVGEGQNQPIMQRVFRLLQGFIAAIAYRYGLKSTCPLAWKPLFDAYHVVDLVIGVAGNQFYSTGNIGWPLPANAFAVQLAHIFGKPFYTMPQSIGPFKRRWEHWVMRQIYGKAQQLFLREKISVQLAHDIGIQPQKIHFAPDPAFGFLPASVAEATDILRQYPVDEKKPKIGVTVIAPMGRALDFSLVLKYYQAIATLLNQVIDKFGVQVLFFNQVTGPSELEDDRTAVREVMAAMGEHAQQAIWVNENLSPQQLKACYGVMDFFIASRLHSGIFALSQGVPTLFIGYLTKTRGVLDAIGLADWVIDLKEINEERLLVLATRAWLERGDYSAVLEKRMRDIVIESQQTMALIAQDYDRYLSKKSKLGKPG